MSKICKSKLDRLKIALFRAISVTILLYDRASWTLTKAEKKKLDGVYTSMLRKTHENVNWRNNELYGNLKKVSTTVR